MGTIAFALDHATAAYGDRTALHDVTLEIARGTRVAVLGKSGAGKSTLIRVLYESRAEAIALVPQELGLVANCSVFHNIYMGGLDRHAGLYNLLNLAWPQRGEVAQVRDVAEALGIGDKLFEAVGRLSGGQQQRTAIGRAIFRRQPIFLGDEPVSALDAQLGRLALGTVADAHETSVIALHDTDLALEFADRVIGIADGGIALDRPASALKASDLADLYQ